MPKLSYLWRINLVLFAVFVFMEGCVSRAPKAPSGVETTGVLEFQVPVEPGYRITQHFNPYKKKPHKGVDIGGKKHSRIFSIAKGRVIYAGSKFSGYGKMVLVKHPNGMSSLYAHLHKIHVKAGDPILQGHPIGTMGRTGRASGVHLHLEVMKNKVPVDPLKYIPLKTGSL